jgi:hypothetical protein
MDTFKILNYMYGFRRVIKTKKPKYGDELPVSCEIKQKKILKF